MCGASEQTHFTAAKLVRKNKENNRRNYLFFLFLLFKLLDKDSKPLSFRRLNKE